MGDGSCCVCKEAPPKYKCPSCRTPYCSVTCFKKHKGTVPTLQFVNFKFVNDLMYSDRTKE
ncbi:HIT-type Zinc finger family protein [Zea mays]|uniref:HIT-type Zinc finger family protein n=1 Tax=Zea mays TaxID=4577 RepID=A0A1D6N7Y1_MAIZE|nr:HIT-type Zinc finger family protein [Zea mays]